MVDLRYGREKDLRLILRSEATETDRSRYHSLWHLEKKERKKNVVVSSPALILTMIR